MAPNYFFRVAVKLVPVTASKRDFVYEALKTPRVQIRLEDWFRKPKPTGPVR